MSWRERAGTTFEVARAEKDGQPLFALGTPGGTRIFPAVLQAIVNVIDHGMSLQEAVEAPRVCAMGEGLEVEEGIAEEVRAPLVALGHEVKVVPRVAGGMNGVLRDPASGLLRGAACWRADGTSLGMRGGFTSRIGTPGVPTSSRQRPRYWSRFRSTVWRMPPLR
jgi:gamma-glutamyltranspeptidase/glutathione hydrolase